MNATFQNVYAALGVFTAPERKEPTMITNSLRHLFCRVAVSAGILLSVAPAALAYPPSASQMAEEHHACAVTLGLDPSEAPYDACVRSLDSFLSQSNRADLAPLRDSAGPRSNIAAR